MNTIRNYVTLVGSIGTPAKITKYEDGKSVARFSLATQKVARNNDGKYTAKIQWHRVYAWGNLAGFIEEYAEKGKKVAIHGRLVTRTFLSQTGKKQTVTEVELRNIIGL
jgi:single-strand DNA-binding protein